jgi:VWFA-related protein
MRFSTPLAVAVLAGTSPARPQALSAPVGSTTTNRRISLDIVVTDRSGSPLAGFQQQDVTILDNKRPLTIASFHAPAEASDPQRVVFVIDEVNVSFRAMSNARQQLEKYLRQNEGKLPVPMSLVVFNEHSTQVQGTPVRDGNLLANSVSALGAGAPRELEGAQLANEMWRLQISLRAFQKLVAYEAAQPGRKLLIWLGPGWPIITESADNLTAKDKQTDFHTLVAISTAMRDARLTAYSVDPSGADDAASLRNVYYENFLGGVLSASKFRSGDLALGVIAVQSGGLVLNRNNDISGLIAKCVADANSYYTLAFDSTPAAHPDEYHDLQVKTEKPGTVIRTRTGYYAQP